MDHSAKHAKEINPSKIKPKRNNTNFKNIVHMSQFFTRLKLSKESRETQHKTVKLYFKILPYSY